MAEGGGGGRRCIVRESQRVPPPPSRRPNMAVIIISLILQLVLAYIFSPMEQQSLVGQGFLIIGVSRSHSDTQHSVGLLWMGDQPDTGTSTLQQKTQKRQTSKPLESFELTIPESERLKTKALDRAATGTGFWYNTFLKFHITVRGCSTLLALIA